MEGPAAAEPAPDAEKHPRESDNSEDYDSAEGDSSYSDEGGEDDERVRPRSRASEGSEGEPVEGIRERESGDGQESVPNKKVDHDEDKKNPQYIPKRGTFYEHDDRTLDEPEDKDAIEAEKSVDKDGKKKVWADKKERWTHDRFNDSEQAPKSKSELVAIYGYDIRNEDGPPRARRRRRYGRGPNKYTRNWKDEDAYNKPPPAVKPRKPLVAKAQNPRGDDFPPLNDETTRGDDESGDDHRNSVEQSETTVKEEVPEVREGQFEGGAPPPQRQNSGGAGNLNVGRAGSGRVLKPRREMKQSDFNGFTARGHRMKNAGSEQQRVLPPRNKKDDYVQSQNFTNTAKSLQQQQQQQHAGLEHEMSKLNVQDGVYRGQKGAPQGGGRQGSVPPRLQAEQKGPKRYSSMRQRSLPETSAPPPAGGQGVTAAAFPHSFYPNDYDSTAPPPPSQAPIMAGTGGPPPPPIQLAPAAAPPAVLAPAQFAPPFAQPPPPPAAAFMAAPPPAGPPPPPAAFLAAAAAAGHAPPPQAGLVGFAPPPQHRLVAAGVAAGFQGFQQPFSPVTQPAELYQPQGGICYYSTDQQLVPRAVPPKRPKAAIPIVAPDEAAAPRREEKPAGDGVSGGAEAQTAGGEQ